MGNSNPSTVYPNGPTVSNFYNYPPRRREQPQPQHYYTNSHPNRTSSNTNTNNSVNNGQIPTQNPYNQSRTHVPQMRQQNNIPQQTQRQSNYNQQRSYSQQQSSQQPHTHQNQQQQQQQHVFQPRSSQPNVPRSSQQTQQQQHQQQGVFRPHPSVGKEKIVTTVDAIENLPVVKYTIQREELMQHCFDSCSCSICMDDFQYEDSLLMLPCQHIFHSDCVKPWLRQHSNSCPVCRYELEVGDYQEEKERKARMKERFTEEGLKIIETQCDIERILEKVYQVQKIFEQKQHIENLYREDIIEMDKELVHFDTQLENKTFMLDNISHLQNEKLKEQKKYCIRKIQGIQMYINQLKTQMQKS